MLTDGHRCSQQPRHVEHQQVLLEVCAEPQSPVPVSKGRVLNGLPHTLFHGSLAVMSSAYHRDSCFTFEDSEA
jgi:hypothetical protein